MPLPVRFIGDVAHQEHPSFENRKELAGKTLAVLHFDLAGGGSGELSNLSQMVRQRSAHRAFDNRVNLVDFLSDLHSKATDALAESPEPTREAQDQVAAFKAHADELDCTKCTAEEPCSGRILRDAALVAAGGLCLSVVTRMFAALVDLATKGYRDVHSSSAPAIIRIVLKTEISRRDGGELGGKTEFPQADALAARQASVTATLPLTEFGPQHLARLPYVLFHELFVHCPESWASVGPRRHTKETCGFREGFVDGAAASLLSRALNSGMVELSAFRRLSGDFAHETLAAHMARTSLVAVRRSAAAPGLIPAESLRRKGAKAFALFREAVGTDAELLAAALNVLDASDEERSAFLILLESIALALPHGLEAASPYLRSLALDLRRLLSARPVDADAIGNFFRTALPEEY